MDNTSKIKDKLKTTESSEQCHIELQQGTTFQVASANSSNFSYGNNPSLNNKQHLDGDTTADEESFQNPKKKSKRNKKNRRTDHFGSIIERGSKQHKISFKEEIEDVHEVENWKQHNKIERQDYDPFCDCDNCSIF